MYILKFSWTLSCVRQGILRILVLSTKCGEWPYSFSTFVANEKILLDNAAVNNVKMSLIKLTSFLLVKAWQKLVRSILFFRRKMCAQFHQHFMSSFCANLLAPKTYKAKMYIQKSCLKGFCTKKLLVKCWRNWQVVLAEAVWTYTSLARNCVRV